MDWSSVYEDEGEEAGNWIRHSNEACPSARTHILESMSLEGQYTPFICYAFTVNYILGVGCLGIPYAFFQSGILLGTILIIILSYVSYITVLWIALATQQELTLSIYRAKSNPFLLSPLTALAKRRKQIKLEKRTRDENEKSSLLRTGRKSIKKLYSSITSVVAPPDQSPSEKLRLQIIEENNSNNSYDFSSRKRYNNNSNQKAIEGLEENTEVNAIYELEVTDLAEEFLGFTGKISYQSALMALTYVGLLAYTQVFNDTFHSQLWPNAPRIFPPILFGLIVVPLSCYDLAEQVTVQVTMAALRFLALGILLIGTIVALIIDWDNSALHRVFHEYSIHDNDIAQQHGNPTSLPLLQWNGFGVMFTTAIFSQLFQHSVPGLIRPLADEDKKHVPLIFRNALITTASIYIATGSACVLYFGDNLKQSVNLNFVGFQWGLTNTKILMVSMLVRFIAMIVVLFPALDTLSVFPLIAITLGNNLNAAFPGLDKTLKMFSQTDQETTANASLPMRKRIAILCWRLLAAIPPIVASLLVSDLVISLQIAGLCGIIVALAIPALLHKQSQYRIALIPASMKTDMVFPDYYHSELYVVLVLLLAGLAIVISVAQMM